MEFKWLPSTVAIWLLWALQVVVVVPGTQTRCDVVTPWFDESRFVEIGVDEIWVSKTVLFSCWGWTPIWLVIVATKPPPTSGLPPSTVGTVPTGAGKEGGSWDPRSKRYLNWGWVCCCSCCWARVGWDNRVCRWLVALEEEGIREGDADIGRLGEDSETGVMDVTSCWCWKGCCREDGVDETPPAPKVAPEAVGDDEVPKCLVGITSSS